MSATFLDLRASVCYIYRNMNCRKYFNGILAFAIVSVISCAFASAQTDDLVKPTTSQYQDALNDLVVSSSQLFRENMGQWDKDILYQTSGQNATASFYQDKVFFSLRKDIEMSHDPNKPFETRASLLNWSLSFENSSVESIKPAHKVERNVNYFGPNSKNGVHLPEYKSLSYTNVYPNIDLQFYSTKNGELKYDYIIKPGAKTDHIQMVYDGVQDIKILSNGQLSLTTDWGVFKEDKPYSYQMIDGEAVEVEVRYVVDGDNVGFEVVGDYDKEKELIIDPIYVDWSTYFYGDLAKSTPATGYVYILDVDIDDEDYVYICGMVYNQKFYSELGGYDTTIEGYYDAFACKITPDGDSLKYFTYFGGSSGEYAMNVSVNSNGEAAISGITWGGGFPTTSGAFDENGKNCGAGSCWQGFVTKFDDKGSSLKYSTFLTGTKSSTSWSVDWIRGMQVTDDGKVYLVGVTTSEDFPTTTGCYQDKYGGSSSSWWWNSGDGFLTCLKPDGSGLVFSTYIGGNGDDRANDLFVAPSGEIYVVGQTSSNNFQTTPGAPVFNKYVKGNTDGFIIKFKASGQKAEFAKLMGGSGDESFEGIYATDVGEPYIVGNSNSSNFPVSSKALQKSLAGGYDLVIVKMISAGTNFRYSTYLGGNGDDGYSPYNWWFENASITANVKEEAIIAATSKSTDFPVTGDALQSTNNGLSWYGKLTISKLSYTGTEQKFGTYFGGSGGEFPGGIRAKRVGCVTYILSAGNSYSGDYPTTSGVYRESRSSGGFWTGFVTKFRDTLFTEPIELGLDDSIVECDKVYEIFDAQNQGADFLWSDGVKDRYNIVTDSGTLWVQATYGCDTVRDTINIALEHSPKVPVFGNDTTYCDNFPTLLLDAKNDTIIRTYRWQNGDDKQRIWVSTPGKYYVDVITPNCGTQTDTLNLSFLKTPKLNLPQDTVDCDSVTITLDAMNPNNEVKYKWSTGDSVQSIEVKSIGTYGAKVSNFCGADSADVEVIMHKTPAVELPADSVFCNSVYYKLKVGEADNGETYVWEDLLSQTSLGTDDSIILSSKAIAKVIITNECGSAVDSVELGMIKTPGGGIVDTIYECDVVNESLVMSNVTTNNEEVYSWSVAGQSNPSITVGKEGQYIGYITNKCGVDSSVWEIILKKTPQVTLPNDSTYCGTILVNLDVADPDPEMTYEWNGGEKTPALSINKPGTYSVKLTNRCGTAQDEVTYKLLQMPVVDLGKDEVFCGSVSPVDYTVGDPDNEETYLWSTNSTEASVTIAKEGDHWIKITNYCGTVSDTVNFRVSPFPVVDLGPDTILCGNFSLDLDAGNSGMSYLWMPDGEATQSIKATKQITYTVVVTNDDGCEGTDDFTVGTQCISYYHIPTGFSPNNDGINDVFKPTLINFEKYTMAIHNRWGEAIFESDNPNVGWDGTYKGETVQNGVYLYTIRFITTENGEFQQVKGLVNVIR